MKMGKFLYPFIAMLILASCGNEIKQEEHRSDFSGGTLKINESGRYMTLYPPSTRDIVSSHIINQIHWGLVRYDVRNLSVLPAIANSWEVDSLGTTYTFHLNTNACFHDDACFDGGKGRKIVANDFKYSIELLATQDDANKNFFGSVDKILGAKEFYQKGGDGIRGIKVVNDSTLQITIEKQYDLFVYHLANPACVVLAKEAIEKYGTKNLVGSGPFKIEKEPAANEDLYLARNENFFMLDDKGYKLPYLDSVKISFVGSTKTEIRLFVENQLDMVLGLNNAYVSDFLDENIDKFEANPPEYNLTRSEKISSSEFNLMKSNVNNFYTNKMDNLDLSIVYLQSPQINDQRAK